MSRTLKADRVTWREQKWVRSWQQAVAHARAHGCRLEIAILRDERTMARVEYRRRDGTDAWELVEKHEWPDSADTTIIDARRWCELAADQHRRERLVGAVDA